MTHVGERWGNYQLVQLLGQGGFAEVYLGEHVRLGMQAAIKILHSRLAGDDIANFQHEAKTIAELAHPHIIRVLDFDVQQGVPFLVLEYAPNGSLRQKHPYRERVPLAQVADYVQQIASALQYAHDLKLIHRDVKPENMLLNTQGRVVLTDFGIATLAHSTSSMRTQEATGTLAYMAPEQIQGRPRPASDQYALAVTVYQWLSGSLPFQGSSTELIAQHLAVMPAPMREKAPDIPLEVDQVTRTALMKNPQERFGNIQAFANAFSVASSQTPPAISSSPPAPQAPPATAISGAPEAPLPRQISSTVRATPQARSLAPTRDAITSRPQFARKKHASRRNWLIAVLLIGLIGGIVAVAILVNLRPSNANITSCAVGSDYDSATGRVVRESDHFSSGVTITLVCQIAPGSDPSLVTDGISCVYINGGGSAGFRQSGLSDSTHNVYYNSRTFEAGSCTWDAFYNDSQEAEVSFQVT